MSGFEIESEFETAIHEAGHAIVGDALGLGVALLRVDGSRGLCQGAGSDAESLGGRFLLITGTVASMAAVLLLRGEDPLRVTAWVRDPTEYLARRTALRELAADGTPEQRRRAWTMLDDLRGFARQDTLDVDKLLSADPGCTPDLEAAVRLAASILRQRWPGVLALARAVLAEPRGANGARVLEGEPLAAALADARTRTRLAELLALDAQAGGRDA